MSRCFVFPPPGYVMSRPEQAVNEAVLKVKEKHRDKKERREKKKEKKRAKKRLENGEDGPVVGSEKEKRKHRDHKKHEHKHDKIVVLSTLTKAKEDAELLERSCVSEEHEQEQAIGVQNQSPDSLDRSSGLSGLKRALGSSGGVSEHDSKRQKITPIEKGKGLWIRLPVKNTEHQQQVAAKQVRPCIIIKPPVAAAAAAAREDLGASTLHHTPLFPPDVGKTGGDVAGIGDKITRSRPQSPPPLPKLHFTAPPGDDMEWLFKRKCSGETVRDESNKTLIWSRTCYLPSIDMHALPYVVPY